MKTSIQSACILLASPLAFAQVEYEPFPPQVTPLPFNPTNISGDGTTVVGTNPLERYLDPTAIGGQGEVGISRTIMSTFSSGANVWTMQNGTEDLYSMPPDGAYDFRPSGISKDGRFIAGTLITGDWNSAGFILDRTNPGDLIIFEPGSSIADISDNGLSIVGFDSEIGTVYWLPDHTSDDGPIVLGSIPSTHPGQIDVYAMDGAGSRAVGRQFGISDFGMETAVYWNLSGTESPPAIPIPFANPDSEFISRASDISRDGNFIVGEFRNTSMFFQPFLYAVGGDIVEIPIPGAIASGVSNTGRVVRTDSLLASGATSGTDGSTDTATKFAVPNTSSRAYIYDEPAGIRTINRWLADSGVELGPVIFATADAISEDGTVVVGTFNNQFL